MFLKIFKSDRMKNIEMGINQYKDRKKPNQKKEMGNRFF